VDVCDALQHDLDNAGLDNMTSTARQPPTRLLVARHGQSEWNAIGRWQGLADAPLSEHGMRQAADAGLALGMFDAIWASHLQRASLTANIIAEIVGIGPVLIDERLRETDVGPWQGLTHDEVEQGWPGYLAEHRRPEGFEPYDDAAARVLAAFHDIAAAHPGGEVLVISHGGAIRAVRRLLGASGGRLANLGASWFTVHNGAVSAGDLVALIDVEAPGTAL
jgi:probable phosphoglycerate mutase